MSARVAAGLAPSGRPHPTTKWSLLMALMVVVVLGAPNIATAGQPSVQPPTGPQSGGYFTGTYTFATYIYCTAGFSFNSSYSNNLEGTHDFVFYGAADGSLLVTIDGGGMQLVTSCGDPFTAPHSAAASYTVTKYSTPPPTPTPPPPTPTPTPPPAAPGAPSGGGGSGGAKPSGSGAARVTPTSTPTPAATPSASPPSSAPVATPTSSPAASPASAGHAAPPPAAPSRPPAVAAWTWIGLGLAALLTLGLGALLIVLARSRDLRAGLRSRLALLWLKTEPHLLRLKLLGKRLTHIHGHELPKPNGLSPHAHSGRILAHHHTSYPALAFLVLVSMVLASAYAMATRADSAGTQVSLTVLGPPPTVAATIDQPENGDRFTTATITVRGTCPTGLLVEIYRNGAFAGSASCDNSGLYNVLITLVPGQNDLVARDLDGLNQYGPDSATVSVYYDPPILPPSPSPSVAPSPVGGGSQSTPPKSRPTAKTQTPSGVAPLLLDVKRHFYLGLQPSESFASAATISGGSPPYVVTWDWSDRATDSLNAANPGEVSATHIYPNPGIYRVTIRVRDAVGREAAMTIVAIVSGLPTSASTPSTNSEGVSLMAWPALAATMLTVASFWLGERHKLALLRAQIRSNLA